MLPATVPLHDASHLAMVLALAIVLLTSWLLLWGIFHLAGNSIHLALAAGLGLLVFRIVRDSVAREPPLPSPSPSLIPSAAPSLTPKT